VFPIASLQLVFDVLARDNASTTFRNVGNAAERTGKQADGFGGSMAGAAKGLDGLVSGLKVAGAAFAGAAIVSGLKSLFNAADESARITARTENVIKTMGNAAGISADQVGDLAGAIAAKTGIDDEAIQSGQNLLLTFSKVRNEVGEGNDIFNRTSRIMVDMSAAMGTDASGSAIQLGKALNDPIRGITALTRVGVAFTEQQKEQIRTLVESGDTLGAQRIILGELEKQFGGAAEAMSTPLDRAKVAVGNLAEELGTYLLPVVGGAAEGLLGLIEGFQGGETSADGFKGAMQTTGAVLADVAGFLGEVGGIVGDVVGFFAALPGPVLAGVAAFAGFQLLKGPVSSAFETISLKALYLKDSLGATAAGGLRGAAGGLVGFLGGPWGIALSAAAIGVGFLAEALADSDEAAQSAEDFQRELADALKETNGEIDDSVRALAAHRAIETEVGGDNLLQWAQRLGVELPTVTDALLGNADAQETLKDAIDSRIAVLDRETAAGGQRAAAAGTERASLLDLQNQYDSLGTSLGGAVEDNNLLTAATEASAGAVEGAAGTTVAYTASLQAAADAADDAKAETNLLKSALDALTGANVSVDQATAAYYDSLDQAKESLGDLSGEVVANNGLLDLSSERGREVADRLIDLSDNSHGYLAALVSQGAGQEEVARKDAELRDAFYQTARQMTGNDDAARDLTDRYYGIPTDIDTTVTADTGPAERQIGSFLAGIAQTGALVSVSAALASARNVFSSLAYGGPVPGFSPHKRADNVPVMATAGEYMQNVDAVDYYGVGFMEALNRRQIPRDQLQYLASGGRVGVAQYPISVDPAKLFNITQPTGGTPGDGSVGGAWGSIWQWIRARVPSARINSTYRPGDPGYHGKGKAVDLGFGSGPGGNGSAGLALINRTLFDGLGANLAELIYDGIGDDRPDIKNGRPHTYNAGTRAEHHNHVHAAVYGKGTNYVPEDGPAYLHKGEAVVPAAENQGRPYGPQRVVQLYTPDIPSAIRALRAEEHQQEMLAPAW
jgi:hypothetical protein